MMRHSFLFFVFWKAVWTRDGMRLPRDDKREEEDEIEWGGSMMHTSEVGSMMHASEWTWGRLSTRRLLKWMAWRGFDKRSTQARADFRPGEGEVVCVWTVAVPLLHGRPKHVCSQTSIKVPRYFQLQRSIACSYICSIRLAVQGVRGSYTQSSPGVPRVTGGGDFFGLSIIFFTGIVHDTEAS
jgi:hypothetical protein